MTEKRIQPSIEDVAEYLEGRAKSAMGRGSSFQCRYVVIFKDGCPVPHIRDKKRMGCRGCPAIAKVNDGLKVELGVKSAQLITVARQ